MARRSENRGFASMDPGRRRRIASEGDRSSHRGHHRGYADEYDDDYDEDENRNISNGYEDDYDGEGNRGNEDDYDDTGYDGEDEYDEGDDDKYDRRRSNRGSMSRSGRRGRVSRRGFARMDPEQQRRIGRMGGEATPRTHGRDFYEEIGHERGHSVLDEYRPEFYSRLGKGERARWDEGEDYDRGRSRSGYGSRSSSGNGSSSRRSLGRSSSGRSSSGRRGFGAMSREQVRKIARKGGLARWGESEASRGRSSNRSGRSRGR